LFLVALGARVIAAAGSEVKLDVARRVGGADYVIDYSKPGWQKTVLEITNGKGVDVIYDPVGLIKGKLVCMAGKRTLFSTMREYRFPKVYRLEGPRACNRFCWWSY
jgi:threonine dehydrogenase-like Zn-dependent dehydrogenase